MTGTHAKVIAASFVVLVGCIAAVYTIVKRNIPAVQHGIQFRAELENAELHPQYAATEAALRTLGIPTRLADIFPKPPPDALNAAPIYRKYPEPASPDRDYGSAVKISSLTAGPANWLAARRILHLGSNQVQLAEHAAHRPYCVFPRYDNGSDPENVLLPEFAKIRDCSRMIMLKSVVMAKDGNPQGAVTEQALGFAFGRHIVDDFDSILGQLVGMACDANTLAGMQAILRLTYGDPVVAGAVELSVSHDYKTRSLVDLYKYETAFGNAEIHYYWKQGPAAFNEAMPDKSEALPFRGKQWDAFIDLDGSTYLDMMRRSITAAALPYPKDKLQLDAIQNEMTTNDAIRYIIPAILRPKAEFDVSTKTAMIEADAAVTSAAAAVFVWKGKHGRYPDRLDQVMSPVPADPFDLKPLRYRRDGVGFVVYSVGETLNYDGRAFDSKKHYETVFRYPPAQTARQ